jgi:hypothetical protein
MQAIGTAMGKTSEFFCEKPHEIEGEKHLL